MANPTIQYPQVFQVVGQDSSSDALTVQNTGITSVYISRYPGVDSNTFEHVIGPGGDWTWPAQTALFVAVGVGLKGQISYGPNGSTVNSGSTYTQNSNQPTLIYSVPITYPTGVFSKIVTKTNIQISQFASVFFTITGNLASYPLPVTFSNFMRITAQQSGDTTGVVVQEIGEFLLNTMNSVACSTLQIPVRNKNLSIIFEMYKANAADPMSGTHTLNVFGSNEVITTSKYIHNSLDLFGSIALGGFFYTQNGPATSSNDYNISTKNGPMFLSAVNLTGTTAAGLAYMTAFIAENGNIQPLTTVITPGTAQQAITANGFFPMRPIILRIITATPNYIGASVIQ